MKLFYLLLVAVLLACTPKEPDPVSAEKSTVPKIPEPLPMPSKPDTVDFKNCFIDLPYTHVVAYHYKTEELGQPIVDKKGKLSPLVTKENGLHPVPLRKLTMVLSDPESYSDDSAECFSPEFGIVFYRNKKIIAHVSICFKCKNMHSTVTLPGGSNAGFSEKGLKTLKEIYTDLMLD